MQEPPRSRQAPPYPVRPPVRGRFVALYSTERRFAFYMNSIPQHLHELGLFELMFNK